MAFKLRPVPRSELIAQWLRGPSEGRCRSRHPRPCRSSLRRSPNPAADRRGFDRLAHEREAGGVTRGARGPDAPSPPGPDGRGEERRHSRSAGPHDRLFGSVPFDGPLQRLPPQKIDDWVTGVPLAFLIEMGGKRIFINSGGRPNDVISKNWRPVDLAILGVAASDSIQAVPPLLAQLRPRYFLPSHQDDFFRPLERGFVFLPLTDFPAVRAAAAASSSELILLDYFRPWVLR